MSRAPGAVPVLHLGAPPGWCALVMACGAGVMAGACALHSVVRGASR